MSTTITAQSPAGAEPDPRSSQARVEPPASWTPRPRNLVSAALLLWILSGVYLVPTDQQAVVTRFGAVVEPRVLPGVHYALPWPIDSVSRLKVQQLQRLVIGGEAADMVLGRTEPLVSQFLTGDQNIIQLRVVVQYSVGLPADYLFRAADVAQTTRAAVEAELARQIARSEVDAILTTEKLAIQDAVLAASQKRLNDYRAGVKLSTVNIESVTAPPEAADAFRDVASARADTARIVSEAQSYANDLLPRARGEARQMIESAEAYRSSKVNEAAGDAARFSAVAAEYGKAPDVTSERLYVEALEQVLPKIRKLIVDPNGNLDLSIIRKGEPAK
ncbi:MAG TPA: FtsH protease activity modulator HflK [Bryobacteraceae bacterium]|nr:FtsH protease activity modulator HflK [Bryobacteraceae bacterium]